MENYRELIEKIDGQYLKVLIKAANAAQINVSDDPNTANLVSLERATKMLADYIAGEKEPSFENRKKALLFLQKEGYKIEKSKLYADCKKGLLKLQADGSVLESDINSYIRRARLEKPAEIEAKADNTKLIRRKQERDIEKLEEQIADLKFKREVSAGKYMLKTDVEMEIAARAAALDAGLRHMYQSKIPDWVEIVAGDPQKTAILLESINQDLDDQLNEFANMSRFQVIFVNELES